MNPVIIGSNGVAHRLSDLRYHFAGGWQRLYSVCGDVHQKHHEEKHPRIRKGVVTCLGCIAFG